MGSLFVVVTSVLSSGVIAAFISFHFSEAKERWLIRRTKIEEIYLNSSEWLNYASAYFLPALAVCRGKITYNQMLDEQLKGDENISDIGRKLLRVKMDIYMYEPVLIPLYEKVDRERGRTIELIAAIRGCWEETGQASEFLHLLNEQLSAFDAANVTFQNCIIERGITIGLEKGQAAQVYDVIVSKFFRLIKYFKNNVKQTWMRLLPRRRSDSKKS